MSEPWVPDPEERRFAEMVRQGARQLREERGPCPNAEELVAFFERRLEPEDATRVESHVEACGLCDAALGRLEAARQTGAESGWKTVLSFLRRPAIAYGVVLVLLFPAYRGITLSRSARRASDLSPLPISAPRYILDTVRGAQSLPTVKLASDRDAFILSFLVPVRPKFRYTAQIGENGAAPVSPATELVAEDDLGHCSVICPRELFRPGMYALTVKERTAQGNLTDRQFTFQFLVEK